MLELKNLCFALSEKKLIQDISLTFQSGKIHGIIGPNGSGKTTLLKCLSGIWKLTKGQVFWQREELLQKSRKEISRILTLVSQHQETPFDFTVLDIVAMGRYPHLDEEKQLIQTSLEKVNAWHLKDRSINELSQGERQRVLIARSLATEAPILLLDEPTASLDFAYQNTIWKLLKEQADLGKMILITVHDLHAAAIHCDTITLLHEGKAVATGIPEQILKPNHLLEVFNITAN